MSKQLLSELAPLLPLARLIERRVIAVVAMHGLLCHHGDDIDQSSMGEYATQYADGLIAELDKPKAEGGAA